MSNNEDNDSYRWTATVHLVLPGAVAVGLEVGVGVSADPIIHDKLPIYFNLRRNLSGIGSSSTFFFLKGIQITLSRRGRSLHCKWSS